MRWCVFALLFGLGAMPTSPASAAGERAGAAEPLAFQVEPSWPKPLPNNWIMGQASGVAVDGDDHVWVIQRPRTLTDDE